MSATHSQLHLHELVSQPEAQLRLTASFPHPGAEDEDRISHGLLAAWAPDSSAIVLNYWRCRPLDPDEPRPSLVQQRDGSHIIRATPPGFRPHYFVSDLSTPSSDAPLQCRCCICC